MMTLKEAIEHCLEKSLSCNNQECALEHFQLYKWLQEYKSMLEKQGENNKSLYIRFGDIPKNEKSKVYNGEIEIGTEKGVSVYPAFEDSEGNIVLGLSLPVTKISLYTQQHLLEYDNRACYLVSGDYVGKGTDGEPLLRNIKIIREIKDFRVKQGEQETLCDKCRKAQPSQSCQDITELGRCYVEHEQKSDNYYCQENCKGFQETGKCFADGDCKAKRKAKSIYEVKPKFKVGDWICNDMCDIHIASIENGMYYFDEGDGLSIVFVDEHYHLWTIEDAIDGDILAFNDETIVIFKDLYNKTSFHSYCHIEDGIFTVSEKDIPDWWEGEGFYPATRKQRDLLFAKMKEAGWEWDAEKKELKKINVELTDFEKSLEHIMIETLECGDTRNLKADAEMLLRLAQNPTKWSEEDERNMQNIDSVLFYDKKLPEDTCVKLRDFLKTLKERVGCEANCTTTKEWSEEDEKRLNSCLSILRPKTLFGNTEITNIDTINTKWLKSLKQRIGG